MTEYRIGKTLVNLKQTEQKLIRVSIKVKFMKVQYKVLRNEEILNIDEEELRMGDIIYTISGMLVPTVSSIIYNLLGLYFN